MKGAARPKKIPASEGAKPSLGVSAPGLRFTPRGRTWAEPAHIEKRAAGVSAVLEEVATPSRRPTAVSRSIVRRGRRPSVGSTPEVEGEQKRLGVYRRINELYQDKQQNIEDLMSGILGIAVEAMEAEGGSLWLWHSETKQIECRAAVGAGADGLVRVKIPAGKGVVGWVVDERKSTVVEDTSQDDRFYGKLDREQKHSTRTLLASPLMYAGEVLGVIEIVNKSDPHARFGAHEIPFLEDICTPAAMHIKSSFAAVRQKELLKRMESFAQLHESFSSTLELDKLLQLVLAKAISLVGAEVGSVWLVNEGGETIECHVAEGPTRDKVIGLKVKKGQGIIGWVVENLESSIVEDCSKDPRFSASIDKKIEFVTHSMVSAPLSVKGEAIGAIQIINKKGEVQFFNREDLDLLVLFANSAAMYIKNARLFASEKKARELAALIDISKQITATLDLDSVLMTIVNLASDIVAYDRAAISVQPPGKNQFEVRAISGEERVRRDQPEIQQLEAVHAKLAALGKEVLVSDLDAYRQAPEAIAELVQYLEARACQSFWGRFLSDDQGGLGVLTMEIQAKGGVPESKREMMSILIGQCTVAIRNATLYTSIPQGNLIFRGKQAVLGFFKQLQAWPRARQLKVAAAGVLSLAALFFLDIPWSVPAKVEILPIAVTYYAETQGKVGEVLVREGQEVKAGDLLVRLDVSDLLLQRSQKESTREKVVAEMLKLQYEDRIVEYKIKEKEKFSLDAELQLLEKQIATSEVKSGHDGLVVSQDLDKLLGMPVSYGQELIRVAKKEQFYAQFQVSEADADGIRAGNNARFRLYGLPNLTFADQLKLTSFSGEGRALTQNDPERFFTAISIVPSQSEGQKLRPGMTGKGKISAGTRSLAYVLLGRPLSALFLKIFY